ncbi:hypothetical protein BC834DRAFT_513395 [Gloeopeniophorella convolvens]|nr:hypothetical protein BC834DRAFT_513395 [Gloeopeniophorella convolvens]
MHEDGCSVTARRYLWFTVERRHCVQAMDMTAARRYSSAVECAQVSSSPPPIFNLPVPTTVGDGSWPQGRTSSRYPIGLIAILIVYVVQVIRRICMHTKRRSVDENKRSIDEVVTYTFTSMRATQHTVPTRRIRYHPPGHYAPNLYVLWGELMGLPKKKSVVVQGVAGGGSADIG